MTMVPSRLLCIRNIIALIYDFAEAFNSLLVDGRIGNEDVLAQLWGEGAGGFF